MDVLTNIASSDVRINTSDEHVSKRGREQHELPDLMRDFISCCRICDYIKCLTKRNIKPPRSVTASVYSAFLYMPIG